MSSENNTIEAVVRSTKTKSELNKLRSDGFVPGILYGDIDKNINLSVKKSTLDHFLKTTNFKSKVFKINLDGKEYEVLPRDIEFENISNQPIHVDFQKLSANTKVVVWIPVKFLNEETCPGLKMGGVLNIVRRKVELDCPADKIPGELIVDLAKREIGESIHISAINLPEGVVPTIKDRDFTIATVAAPTVVKEPEPAAEEAEATTEGGEEGKTEEAKSGDAAKAGEEKKESTDKK